MLSLPRIYLLLWESQPSIQQRFTENVMTFVFFLEFIFVRVLFLRPAPHRQPRALGQAPAGSPYLWASSDLTVSARPGVLMAPFSPGMNQQPDTFQSQRNASSLDSPSTPRPHICVQMARPLKLSTSQTMRSSQRRVLSRRVSPRGS